MCASAAATLLAVGLLGIVGIVDYAERQSAHLNHAPHRGEPSGPLLGEPGDIGMKERKRRYDSIPQGVDPARILVEPVFVDVHRQWLDVADGYVWILRLH